MDAILKLILKVWNWFTGAPKRAKKEYMKETRESGLEDAKDNAEHNAIVDDINSKMLYKLNKRDGGN